MAVNKIIYGNNSLLDLSSDTLTYADQLLEGITAHAKDGNIITGTLAGGSGVVFASGTFTVASDTATNGYVITHNLGVIPQIFILTAKYYMSANNYNICSYGVIAENIRNVGYNSSNKYAFFYSQKGNGYSLRLGLDSNKTIMIDDSSITMEECNVANLTGGLRHSWVAIGGIQV